jgi:hypothetical protein
MSWMMQQQQPGHYTRRPHDIVPCYCCHRMLRLDRMAAHLALHFTSVTSDTGTNNNETQRRATYEESGSTNGNATVRNGPLAGTTATRNPVRSPHLSSLLFPLTRPPFVAPSADRPEATPSNFEDSPGLAPFVQFLLQGNGNGNGNGGGEIPEAADGALGSFLRRILFDGDATGVSLYTEFFSPNDGDSYETNMNIAERMGGNHVVRIEDPETVSRNMSTEDALAFVNQSGGGACPICQCNWRDEQDNIASSSVRLRTTSCGHTFCDSCIRQWFRLSNRCPVCRVNLHSATQGDGGLDQGRGRIPDTTRTV